MNVFTGIKRLFTGLAEGEKRSTTRVILWLPPHPDRDRDPTFRHFDRRKRELKRQGKFFCTHPGPHDGLTEFHHTLPYALRGGIDVEKLNAERGLSLTPTSFLIWYQTENCVPLCDFHHRMIHALRVPEWFAMSVWLDGLPPPVRVEKAN